MDRLMTIGQLARTTGVTPKTIRYYEQVGLLPIPRRSETGYRQYVRQDVHRLLFIRRARSLGVSIRDLKALTAELDEGRCGTVRPQLLDLVQSQLQTVRQQIAEFRLLQQQLEQVEQQLLAPLTLGADPEQGCQCLELDATTPQPNSTTLGEETMKAQRSIEALTILPTTSGSHEEDCECGCGCDVVQLSVPSALAEQPSTVGGDNGVMEKAEA
ncbi:MerR family transcriptional regulator [Candidatus Entotheonella palauensis]|uniref:MerR family transcriptional regulator n=1 Tax=Candidatus Entotheonella palauensis TaxID=93172 RepID=UPI002117788C|nr:MerR family transcriptional regulator [Candidatus Entotheonella palauensis]